MTEPTTTECDLVVVGLGALGSAAAWAAARRGATVVGLEQFALGHERGASQDHSRIIRLSYHTPGYVAMAKQAYPAWDLLAADTGEVVVERTGGLDLFPAAAAIDIVDYTASMDKEGVPYEVLPGAEVRRRWPVWSGLADDVTALYQAETGFVVASRAVAALQQGARSRGADLRDNTPVTAVRAEDGSVVVTTATGMIRAAHAVVAADAWTNQVLAPLGRQLPLTVLREQVTWFEVDDADRFRADRCPVWIWMDEPCWYGFPAMDGAIKAAEDCGGIPVDPDTRTFEPDPANEARLNRFLHDHLAGVGGIRSSKTCLYTLTPDRDFVLDRVPEAPEVLVALGAAHSFKFAAWFGLTLAQLALDGAVDADLSPFRIDRPALTDQDHQPAWLV
ncbi:MAG TPA: N-methyl-L-tryptophan oxidase [Acidimicrobiales bacterium]